MSFDPYAEGALNEAQHAPLVARLDFFAADAGIQPHWLARCSKPFLTEGEVDYLVDFHKHSREGVAGLCLSRKSVSADPTLHLSAMCAALVRNYIRARVLTLGSVLDDVAASDPPKAQCLLIPNFVVEGLPVWQVGALLDLLLQRQFEGQQTVLFIPDMESLKLANGGELYRFLDQNYTFLGV